MEVPDSLKSITQYIKRAEELEKDVSNPDSKVMAYFCYKFAAEKAMLQKSAAIMPFLLTLMDKLEKQNKDLNISNDKGSIICESFALSVFERAAGEDQAGASTKSTAKLFYAAGTFFDALEQFGPLSEDVCVFPFFF